MSYYSRIILIKTITYYSQNYASILGSGLEHGHSYQPKAYKTVKRNQKRMVGVFVQFVWKLIIVEYTKSKGGHDAIY